jgi:hypothetical protein
VVLYFEVLVQWNWRWEKEVLCSYHLGIAWPDPITGCGFIVAYWGLHTHFTWVTEVTVLRHFKFAALLKVCACTYGSVVDSLGLFNWRAVSDTCQWWLGWEGSPPTKMKVITSLFPHWCFRLFPGHNRPILRELRSYEVRILVPCLIPPLWGTRVSLWLAPCSEPVWHGSPYPPSRLPLAYVLSSLVCISSTTTSKYGSYKV